jgi:hypothetical protein
MLGEQNKYLKRILIAGLTSRNVQRWTGHDVRMEEISSAYRMFAETPPKWLLLRLRRRW